MLNNTKVKTTEIKGKYFSPSLFILSNNNWDDIAYIVSTKTCQVFGVKKLDVPAQSVLDLRK